jgi:ankyrin repeat protein
MLLLLSANVNQVDSDRIYGCGRTPAAFACAGGSFDICRELELAGADFATTDADGRSPAEYAAMFGRTQILHWLWSRGSLLPPTDERPLPVGYKMLDKSDPSILLASAANGYAEAVEALIDQIGILPSVEEDLRTRASGKRGQMAPDASRGSALHAAARGGFDDVVRVLLDRGCSVTRREDGEGILSCAVNSGAFSCVKLLLERGAPPRDPESAAYDAALVGHLDILRALLDADPSLLNEKGGLDCVRKKGSFSGMTPLARTSGAP